MALAPSLEKLISVEVMKRSFANPFTVLSDANAVSTSLQMSSMVPSKSEFCSHNKPGPPDSGFFESVCLVQF